MNEFLKYAEELDWSYRESESPNEGQTCVELQRSSPRNQDFIVTIWFETDNECDFADKLEEYWRGFDPSEEAVIWIGPDGHGINGAPHDLQDIINDMVDCKEMLRELMVAFHNHTYPDKKIKSHPNWLTFNHEDYFVTGFEEQAISNVLTSLENTRTYASSIQDDCIRWELDDMIARFKNQVRDRLDNFYIY